MIGVPLILDFAVQPCLGFKSLLDVFTLPQWTFVDWLQTFAFLYKMVGIGKKFLRYPALHFL